MCEREKFKKLHYLKTNELKHNLLNASLYYKLNRSAKAMKVKHNVSVLQNNKNNTNVSI